MNRNSEDISDININQTNSPLAQQQGAVGGSNRSYASHTGSAQVEFLQLSELLQLKELQVRKELNGSMIRRYAMAYRERAKMPPITVARLVAEEVFVLIDGWHRVAAAKQEGMTTIGAEIVECPSLAEARWLAAQANLTHGVPLKKKEVREVFRRYIETKQHLTKPKGRGTGRKWECKPTSLIAEELKGVVDRRTLLRWLQKDHPEVYERWYRWETNGYHKGKRDWKGTGEPKKQSVDVMLMGRMNDVAVSLNELRLNAKLVDDKYARGKVVNGLEEVIEEAKRVLEEIKGGGEWAHEVNDDF